MQLISLYFIELRKSTILDKLIMIHFPVYVFTYFDVNHTYELSSFASEEVTARLAYHVCHFPTIKKFNQNS